MFDDLMNVTQTLSDSLSSFNMFCNNSNLLSALDVFRHWWGKTVHHCKRMNMQNV